MQTNRHADLVARIKALADGETDTITLMATTACELFHGDDRFDWVGFYRNVGDDTLKIGPYQGGHGCLTIPFSKGVCGACARTGEVQLVPDVDAFPGHIACSSSTRSELVLPVYGPDGTLIGVLDIDSDRPDAFDEEDAAVMTDLMRDLFGGPV
ncbi:GAF domain-containing protein [Rhodospirillaceae bacterium KN72]|uniref:GAF domain-containing protein n=1 Tax=Pacificispira spongiicola TaxID=2729598 RepID=A0A7Y0HDZ6_9PROT|nr:GAF domain-containing protein [Pacificispira spongiicola]NMM42983.1 GAF domain-containing protein [Pacificispira spongiicola]